MNRYRSYMDRIRLDEEAEKRILQKVEAASNAPEAGEKKILAPGRKWFRVGSLCAAAAAAAVILIAVFPSMFKRASAPSAQEAVYSDEKNTPENGAEGGNKLATESARAESGKQSTPAAEVPAAAPSSPSPVFLIKGSGKVELPEDVRGDLENMLGSLSNARNTEGSGSLPTLTSAAEEAVSSEAEAETREDISLLFEGNLYRYSLKTGELTDEKEGSNLVLDEALRDRLNLWLEEQDR